MDPASEHIDRRPPPREMSFLQAIKHGWEELQPLVLQGKDVTLRASLLEKHLQQGRADLASGKMQNFDWEEDLSRAEYLHALNIHWVSSVNKNNSIGVQLWIDLTKRQADISTAMMVNGVNLIVAGHGAAAIAALNAIVSDRGDRYYAAMISTIIGACIGIVMVAVGKILIIEYLSHVSTKVAGKLAYPNPRRVLAVGKYFDKVARKPTQAATWLIYGSIIWFAIYVFFALVVVLNT